MSGQDESNPALWLATWAGKMELSYPLRTTCCAPQKNFPDSKLQIINPYCPSLFGQDDWILALFFLVSLWTSTVLVYKHAKKNLANIQSSWPYTWSITHIIIYQVWLFYVILWMLKVKPGNHFLKDNFICGTYWSNHHPSNVSSCSSTIAWH